jgi:transposase
MTNLEVDGLAEGDVCPCCGKGKLYHSEGRKLLSFTASSPVEVNRFTKEVLRCNACGREHMSNKKITKWDASARSSIALQKVSGMPFHRLSKLQSLYNTPIAESTLWQQVSDMWFESGQFVCGTLESYLSESETLSSDDTKARILEVIQENKALPEKERRDCNSTVICGSVEGRDVVLYVSADRHCGENLGMLLKDRRSQEPVKLMTDASAQNKPVLEKDVEIIALKCLVHARRKFYDLLDFYPDECRYFLNEVSEVYKHEEICRDYSDAEKLQYRKEHSQIHIKNIYGKIEFLFENRLVEPNSNLGRAMQYWINHQEGLCRFLEVETDEIDNNKSERALKSIILQRKNSLFFSSRSSASILSGINSLVRTCALNKVNAFEYLNWIQRNWTEVRRVPEKFFPWHYNALGPPVAA